jgi:hypothetical protein
VTTANISASNITNLQGGLISTVLPSSLATLLGSGNLIPNLNLSLTAINNILNSGSITSAGHLTLTAGGTITNALPAGVTGAMPIMQAAGDVNLNAANVVNSGLVSALAGNINIASQMAQSMVINATGGSFQAFNGAINIQQLCPTATDLTMTGGDYLSQQFSASAGTGNLNIDIGNLTGVASFQGNDASVGASTNSLMLGSINVTDPVFRNNSGSIILPISAGGTSVWDTHGADLAFVAATFISNNLSDSPSPPPPGTVPLTTIKTDGGLLIMVTGATTTSTTPSSLITHPSGLGGFIDLTGLSLLSSANTSGPGGSISLQANSGTMYDGYIKAGGTTIDASGTSATALNPQYGVVTLAAASTQGITAGDITGGTMQLSAPNGTITANSITSHGGNFFYTVNQASAIVWGANGSIQNLTFPEGVGTIALVNNGAGGITIPSNLSSDNGTVGSTLSLSCPTGPIVLPAVIKVSETFFGSGQGGQITITGNTVTLGQLIQADGSTRGGGRVSINGNQIILTGDTTINADGGLFGGIVNILRCSGSSMSISGNGTLTVTADGGNGSSVSVGSVGTLSVASGVGLNLHADAGASGSGGFVTVFANNGALSLNNLTMSANGGTSTGDGGFVEVDAGTNLTINNAVLSASAPGAGNGMSVALNAGQNGNGNLSVLNGSMTATGAGGGNGGTIALSAPTGGVTVGTAGQPAVVMAAAGSPGASSGGVISLNAGNGPINVATANMSTGDTAGNSTPGNIQLVSSGAITVGTQSGMQSAVSTDTYSLALSAGSDINVYGQLHAFHDIGIKAGTHGPGSVTLAADIGTDFVFDPVTSPMTPNNVNVTVTTNGAGNVNWVAGQISANRLLFNNAGNIGTATSPVATNVDNVLLGLNGNVVLSNNKAEGVFGVAVSPGVAEIGANNLTLTCNGDVTYHAVPVTSNLNITASRLDSNVFIQTSVVDTVSITTNGTADSVQFVDEGGPNKLSTFTTSLTVQTSHLVMAEGVSGSSGSTVAVSNPSGDLSVMISDQSGFTEQFGPANIPKQISLSAAGNLTIDSPQGGSQANAFIQATNVNITAQKQVNFLPSGNAILQGDNSETLFVNAPTISLGGGLENGATIALQGNTITGTGTQAFIIANGNIFLQQPVGALNVTGRLSLSAPTGNVIITTSSPGVSNPGGNITFDGSFFIQAQQGVKSIAITSKSQITLAANALLQVFTTDPTATSSAWVEMSSPVFSSKSLSQISDPLGKVIIDPEAGAPSVVYNVPSGSSTSIVAASISFDQLPGTQLIIQTDGTAPGTIALSGGNASFSATGANVNVGSGVNISSDHTVSIAALSGGSLTLGSAGSAPATISGATGVVVSGDTGATVSSNLVSSNGSVSVSTNTGALAVTAGVALTAGQGNLTIQNNDTVAGSISLGNNVTLSAPTTGSTIAVVIGAVPAAPVSGTAPDAVIAVTAGGGNIFWGANSVSAQCCSVITSGGSTVIFNTGSLPASAISLGSGVGTSAGPAPAPVTVYSDLDFSDANVVKTFMYAIHEGAISGNLTFNNGVATGTVNLTPGNLASSVTALNVLQSVTVDFNGFQSTNPVNLGASGSVAGTMSFVGSGSPSNAVINLAAGASLTLASTARLASDGSLTLSSAAGIALNGTISAATSLTVTAAGAGSITQLGGSVTAASVSLSSGSGSIGTAAASLSVTAAQLTANTTGTVYVNDSAAAVSLGASSASGLQVTSAGSLTVAGNVSTQAGSLTLVAGGGNLLVSAGVTLSATEGNLTLQNTSTSGSIELGVGSTLSATSATSTSLGGISLVVGPIPSSPVSGSKPSNFTANVSNGGAIYYGSNGITANGSNNIANVNGAKIVFSTGTSPASAIVLDGSVTLNATCPPSGSTQPPPPGHGGTPPGQGGTPPGLRGGTPPGQGGTPPGQGGTPPGQTGTPPGQINNPSSSTSASSGKSNSHVTPVAFVQSAGALTGLEVVNLDAADMWQAGPSDIGVCDEGCIRIVFGDVVLAAKQDTIIEAAGCRMTVGKGSIVAIDCYEDRLTVRCLHDGHRGSIVVGMPHTNGQISSGEELVFAPSDHALASELANSQVGHRRLVKNAGVRGSSAVSEFSSVGLASSSKVLHMLLKSTASGDKAVSDKIMKTAACLTAVTSSHGRYISP